jgi:hypothetical protein
MICTHFTDNMASCGLHTGFNTLRVKLRRVERQQTAQFRLLALWIALFGCLLCSRTNADSTYVLGTNGNLWREHGTAAHRTLVDSNVWWFSAIDANAVLVLGYDDNLWIETPDQSNRTFIGNNVRGFAALDTHQVYVVDASLNLWREIKSNGSYTHHELVDRNVSEFQPVSGWPGTDVVVLGTDGNLWFEYGNYHARTQVDHSVQSFSAPSGVSSFIYVIDTDSKLWRETIEGLTNRRLVQTNADLVQALDAEEYLNVYVRTTDLSLWREHKDSADRMLVDSDALEFQGLADNFTVYVLHSNFDLWRESGTNNDAVLVDGNVRWFQDVP